MKRINIIAEGQTEQRFIEKTLAEYSLFKDNEIYLCAITIETSRGHKGGGVDFDKYKDKVINLLYENDKPIVTSMIDFYRLNKDFPAFADSKQFSNKYERVDFLKEAILKEIEKEIPKRIDINRFLPYIQLHEFEALLFSDIKGLKAIISAKDKLKEIDNIIKKFPNPEEINDDPNKAPSKRLVKIIEGYERKKVEYGYRISEKIGIETIMTKCPHFKEWIYKLIEMSKTSKWSVS